MNRVVSSIHSAAYQVGRREYSASEEIGRPTRPDQTGCLVLSVVVMISFPSKVYKESLAGVPELARDEPIRWMLTPSLFINTG